MSADLILGGQIATDDKKKRPAFQRSAFVSRITMR